MLNERWALWRVVKWLRQIFSGGEPVEAIALDTGFDNPTHTEGLVFYDNTEYAVSYYNDEAEITIHMGQDSVIRVRNATGSLISKGQVVYSNAATGNRPNIVLARANALSTSRVLGVAGHDIENNTDGYVVRAGLISGIDTLSFTAGDELFLSSATAGALTNSKPTGANFAVVIGECLVSNASVGEIAVDLRPTADAAQKSITQTVSGDWTFTADVVYSDGASDTLTISQSSTLSALVSTQGIRFTPADAHDVEVYRSGSDIVFKVYDSGGTDHIALRHTGTYGRLNNNDGQGGLTVFDAVTVADDATSTFTAPTGRAHGIWVVANTWDDSGYGMFAYTGQSVTQLGGGVNFQLGDAGTNPDVDGDINCWMSSSTVLSVKNRTGGNASIVVYHLGA